jgi:hypothetical protein
LIVDTLMNIFFFLLRTATFLCTTWKGTLHKFIPLCNVTTYSYELNFDIILLSYIPKFWALQALSFLFLNRSSVWISQFLYAGYLLVHLILHLITIIKLDKQQELCKSSDTYINICIHRSPQCIIERHSQVGSAPA